MDSDVQVNVRYRIIGGLLRGVGDFLVGGPLVRAGLAAPPKAFQERIQDSKLQIQD